MAIPKSDVNWERDITVTPTWAKNELLDLGVGTQRIIYHAKHPVSKLTKNCSILLNILGQDHQLSQKNVFFNLKNLYLDGEPPTVLYCPKNQQHTLDKFDDSVQASWTEPVFNDNINITSITKSNVSKLFLLSIFLGATNFRSFQSPGNYFGIGSHRIVYTAHDAAGYRSRCVFKVLVSSPKKHNLYHKLPIYDVY